ncbi:MAG: hypothetical protein H6712_29170 [Myxococcales bacterium]|nr:hypothetical protein [Myxococcales bacterium]
MTDLRTSLHQELSWYAAAWFRAFPDLARPGRTVLGGAYLSNTGHTSFVEGGVQRTPRYLLRVGRTAAAVSNAGIDFSGVSIADGHIVERSFVYLQERGDAVHDDASTLSRILEGYGATGRAWATAIAGASDREARFDSPLDAIDAVPPHSPVDDPGLLVDFLRRHFTYDETGQYYPKWSDGPRPFPQGLSAEYHQAATVELQLDRGSFYCFAVITRDQARSDGRWPALELIARIVKVPGFDDPEITIVYSAARLETQHLAEHCFFYAADGEQDALASGALGITTEQKFQHFLAATVRNGSTYRLGGRVWDYDNDTWVVTDNRYGCVGFATLFLVYWLNFNEDYRAAWSFAVANGMTYGFDESAALHDLSHGELTARGVRGFREFVADGRSESVWILARERSRGITEHWLSFVDTVAGFIDDGRLRLVEKRGARYYFRWKPEIFADFNVVAEASHHVILYVKRGSGGENDPPTRGNTPHRIFRFGADLNSRAGGRTTWREEEIAVEPCTAHGAHGPSHSAGTVHSVTLAPGVARDERTERWIRELEGHAITRPAEQSRNGCLSKYVVWKLRDLRPNGRVPALTGALASDPLMTRPARRVVSRANHEPFAVPQLLRITVSAQVGGQWTPVAAGSTTLRSGMQIRLGIESSNVPAGTPLTIRTLDRSGTHEADVIELATEGDSTTTDFALAPVSPGATIAFEAAVLEGQLRIASEALRVS